MFKMLILGLFIAPVLSIPSMPIQYVVKYDQVKEDKRLDEAIDKILNEIELTAPGESSNSQPVAIVQR